MNVRVHGEGVLLEPLSKDDLSGFASDSRKFNEFVKSAWDLAELPDALRAAHDGLCFAVEISCWENDFFDLFFAQIQNVLSFAGAVFGEEQRRDGVHTGIGALGREDHS